jgi:hypothetical protein
MSSWRDVDQVIAILSSVLETEHIGDAPIQVDGIPGANANCIGQLRSVRARRHRALHLCALDLTPGMSG